MQVFDPKIDPNEAFNMYDEDFLIERGLNPYMATEMEEYIEDAEATVFHVRERSNKEIIPTYRCKHCKGVEFNVGRSGYYTAIKCVKCKWENCVHEG